MGKGKKGASLKRNDKEARWLLNKCGSVHLTKGWDSFRVPKKRDNGKRTVHKKFQKRLKAAVKKPPAMFSVWSR